MSALEREDTPERVLHILKPGEVVERQAMATGAVLAVTNERLIVADERPILLDLPFTELRRIQFDIERGRTATLVIVPDRKEPRVLSVPIERLHETAVALASIGDRLNREDTEGS